MSRTKTLDKNLTGEKSHLSKKTVLAGKIASRLLCYLTRTSQEVNIAGSRNAHTHTQIAGYTILAFYHIETTFHRLEESLASSSLSA